MNRSSQYAAIRISLLVCSIFIFLFYSAKWSTRITHGFTAYYVSARMLLEGEEYATSYDTTIFHSKIKEYGIINVIDAPKNLPTNSLLFLPFALLAPIPAKIVWTFISIISIFLSLNLLLKTFELQWNGAAGIIVIILTLLFKPLYTNIALGQIYIVLLLFFSLGLYYIRRNQIITPGVLLSAAMLVKGYGFFPFVFLASACKKMKLWLTLLVIPIVILLTLPIFPINTWLVYYKNVFITLGRLPSDSHVAYQTINGWLRHLFLFDSRWNPLPLFRLPFFYVEILTTIILLCFAVWVLYYALKFAKTNLTLSFSACIGASVIIAPLAEEYHYVLFLPLFLGLLSVTIFRRSSIKELTISDYVLLFAFFLMAIPIGYTSLQTTAFPLFLLAYPKLYAGILTLIVFIFHGREQLRIAAPATKS